MSAKMAKDLQSSKPEQTTATKPIKDGTKFMNFSQKQQQQQQRLLCVCVWTLPLDGINNNKAKLRDSLITISRFHLTAVPLALKHSGHCVQTQRMSARTCSPVLERCEMCTIERCHLFRVAIKLCFMSCSSLFVGLRLFSRLPCADHHYPSTHPCSRRRSHLSVHFRRNYSVGNIIVNCNFFHNIFMWMRFSLFSIQIGEQFHLLFSSLSSL